MKNPSKERKKSRNNSISMNNKANIKNRRSSLNPDLLTGGLQNRLQKDKDKDTFQ